jgi:hypothetical protein
MEDGHSPDVTMRGYPNKLPYFHRELTQEDKQLIGDITPARITQPLPADDQAHQKRLVCPSYAYVEHCLRSLCLCLYVYAHMHGNARLCGSGAV